MTPQQIIDAARRAYNSINNNFYSDDELLDLLYKAELELAKFAYVIESIDSSTSTVAGTREYALPANCLSIKRVTYDGQRLDKIGFRTDDEMTAYDEETTSQGYPMAYELWGDYVLLRPIPDDAKTLKFYFFEEPTLLTVAGTVKTPSKYHMDLVNKIVSEMAYKDLEYGAGDRYLTLWKQSMIDAKAFQMRRQRSDSFKSVKIEECSSYTQLGLK